MVEWLVLDVDDPSRLGGVRVSAASAPEMEASIYLGGAHNWYQISDLSLANDGPDILVCCEGTVQFENEGVAKNEPFKLQARATYLGEA